MNPEILEVSENNNILSFKLNGVNTSIANSLRRVILSEIPTVVFRTTPYEKNGVVLKTTPYEKNDAIFEVNSTKLNNEILKQRLSCIPIHISNVDNFPIDQYILEVDEKNESSIVQYITTENFKIKNIVNNKYLSQDETSKIFPKNSQTGYYIDFVRLQPKISDTILGEELKFSCKFSVGTAKEEATFNVVSTCCYGFTQNTVKVNDIWSKKETEYKSKNLSNEEIALEKNNFMAIDAKRIYLEDCFDFRIESIGIYKNKDLVKKACEVLINKYEKIIKDITNDDFNIVRSDNTMDNAFNLILEHEDYTLGKVLEFILHEKYYLNKDILSFCGFNKEHPHCDFSIITLAFKKETELNEIFNIVRDCCNIAIELYGNINSKF